MNKLIPMLLSTALLSAGAAGAQEAKAPAPEVSGSEPTPAEPAAADPAEETTEPATDAAATPAAEAGSGLEIEEIVVTARKRAESIQDVPVAVTALSGAMLEKDSVLTIADVAEYAPNVQIAPVTINPGAVVAFIRGVGNRTTSPVVDSPVAISVDGIYLAQASGAMVDVFDMQSVEVLRGPQGTLQGRNSPGGAINLSTRRPTGDYAANAEIGIGSFGRRTIRAAVEAPLIDEKLAGRLSVGTDNFDGQVYNPTIGSHIGGSESYIVRGGLLYTPTENLTAYLTGDYSVLKYEPRGIRYVGTADSFPRQGPPVVCTVFELCTPNDKYTSTTNFNRESHIDEGGVAANINWRLDGMELTSVTGFRETDDISNIDVDGTALEVLSAVNRTLYLNQLSQELRLSSEKDGGYDLGGKLDWIVGAYYMKAKYDWVQPIVLEAFGQAPVLDQDQDLHSVAFFAHAVYKLTDDWSVSAGGRQSNDKKDVSALPNGTTARVSDDGSWSNFSFEAGTDYRIAADKLLYFRYAQGYRSGGIGEINDPAADNHFDPETVDTFEVGAKTEWLDRRLLVNLAYFYSDYADLQRDVVLTDGGGGGILQVIKNAASATIQGVELETQFRATKELSFRATAAYLDASYDNFKADILGTGEITDNSDLRLPFTPKWSGMIAVDYDMLIGNKGNLTLSPQLSYRSRQNLNPTDVHVAEQAGYSLVDATATFTAMSEKWGFGVYAHNIFDKHYIEGAEPTSGITAWELEGLQRNYGIRMFAKF